jgi:hypothetical protein
MSLKKLCFLISTLFILFFNVNIFGENSKYASNIQSIILEDFEVGQDGKPNRPWVIIPERFGRKGSVDSGESLQDMKWVKAWPEAYFGLDKGTGKGELFFGVSATTEEAKKKYTDVSGSCLALKLAFERQGYNVVELYPVALNKDNKYSKTPIPFKGKVQQVDMWIWGANYNYNVEMVIMDFKGVEWRLPVGNIQHAGWKNFVVTIPKSIPQAVTYIPSMKAFSLVKLVIWTTPNEKVTGAYIYIDHIKYLTDVYGDLYDGYQLGDTTYIKDLWEKGAAAPSEKDVNP